MNTVIFVLLFMSIALLLAGLIKPNWAWSKSRKQVAMIFVPATLLLFIGLGVFGGPDQAETAQTEQPAEWFVGGTLHKATVAEWLDAEDRNRLATAGDWSTAILGSSYVKAVGFDQLRVHARDMVVCVDHSVQGNDDLLQQTANNFAAICAKALGWRKGYAG